MRFRLCLYHLKRRRMSEGVVLYSTAGSLVSCSVVSFVVGGEW